MSRLIDANEVVKEILAERDKIPRTVPSAPYELGTEKPFHAGDQMRGGIRKALRCIEQAPTVDAVPVVRKPVVGYEGYYEVDQLGRVFSVDRVISVDDNGRKYEKPIAGKQMKQSLKNKGYKIVSLTKDGTTKMAYVHRLVAEAFIPNPDNLPMVNHKDEDKTNNFLENLEWCTAKYNCNYGTGIKRHADKIKGRESEKRIAVIQRSIDGAFINLHSSVKEAAASVNGTTGAISAACNGRRKTAYGYLWEHDFCSYGEKEGADNEP